MKRILLLSAIVALSLGIFAQSDQDPKTKKVEKKEHVCTDACADGNHVYACGEKGHVCTEACKQKAHVCTEACKDGKHIYACGEKGHVCTEACKKKK